MTAIIEGLNIGIGLFLLAFIWGATLLTCAVLSRADGPARYGGIGLVLFAAVLTLTLWFFPRAPQFPDTEEDVRKFDPSYYQRTVIISVCGIFLLVSVVLYGLFHVLEPIYAKPLKRMSY